MTINWLSLPDAKKQLSAAQYAHLADNGSLTRRVRNSCSGQFKVKLIDQKSVQPGVQERRLLKLSETAQALSRQVFLCCDQQAIIFARTIIGLVRQNQSLIDRIEMLGERSLGSVLFRDPLAIKRHMHLACLSLDDPFFDSINLNGFSLDDKAWLRRSLYDYEGCDLIVYEAFLAFFEAARSAD